MPGSGAIGGCAGGSQSTFGLARPAWCGHAGTARTTRRTMALTSPPPRRRGRSGRSGQRHRPRPLQRCRPGAGRPLQPGCGAIRPEAWSQDPPTCSPERLRPLARLRQLRRPPALGSFLPRVLHDGRFLSLLGGPQFHRELRPFIHRHLDLGHLEDMSGRLERSALSPFGARESRQKSI